MFICCGFFTLANMFPRAVDCRGDLLLLRLGAARGSPDLELDEGGTI